VFQPREKVKQVQSSYPEKKYLEVLRFYYTRIITQHEVWS